MASKPAVNRNQSQRLPAPSLFIGPPSRNASNTSVVPGSAAAAAAVAAGISPNPRAPPLSRQLSQRGTLRGGGDPFTESSPLTPVLSRKDHHHHHQQAQQSASASAPHPPTSASAAAQQALLQTPATAAAAADQHQPSTDAIWAEMQNTLEEVELSATTGTHVFRPGHSQALDHLRTAQIALAQAWARSEAEEDEDDAAVAPVAGGKPQLSASNVLAVDREQQKLAAAGGGSAAGSAAGRPRSGTETSGKSQLEQDTENDILLARRRREANDRYFQRVNAGVLDVVAKLEGVARAMKGVEVESKEMWGDGESVETGSFGSK